MLHFKLEPAQVLLSSQYLDPDSPTGLRVEFADGSVWQAADVLAQSVVRGSAGNDGLSGTSFGDWIDGGQGNDIEAGQSGNDRYYFELGDGVDTVVDDAGVDTVVFGPGILPSQVFIRVLDGGGVEVRYSENDKVVVNPTAQGQSVIEQIQFADGTVWSSVEMIARASLFTGYGDYFVGVDTAEVLDALGGNDIVDGKEGNDSITGGAGADTLLGGDGADTLVGGLDADNLEGMQGDDTYTFAPGSGHDVVYDTREGASENNVIRLAGVAAANVVVSRDAFGSLYLVNRGTADAIQLSGWFGDESVGGTTENRAYRVVFDDGTTWDSAALLARLNTTVVSNTDDVWYGTAGNDTVDGLAGDDVLGGAAGNDIVRGGLGSDVLTEAHGVDLLDGGEGADIGNSFSSSVWIGGKGNDTGYLGELNAYSLALFNAGDGEDVLELYGDNTSSAVLSLGGIAAADISITSSSVGDLRLSFGAKGSIDLSLYQDAGASTILQIVAPNAIQSYDLAAVVTDWQAALAANPNITQWAVSASLAAHQLSTSTNQAYGGDVAYRYALDGNLAALTDASISQRLGSAGFLSTRQTLSAAAIMGTAGNDSLTGTSAADILMALAGNDTLNGGAGADTMLGGAGNDTYVVDNTGDVITEVAGEGLDLVQSSVTYTLASEVENLTLTGTSAINGTGNTLDNALTGNSANNTLTGGAGNDTLDGSTGNDTMVGGAGNDTYVVNVATDVVTELANEGTDTVQSSVTLTLASNVENLTLTGTTAINGTGNTLDNYLTGNSAANTLTGAAGNDTLDGGAGTDSLVGGAGNDTYIVDATTDVVTELASEGTDTVRSSATFTLGSNVENLVLTGTAAINGTGNTLANSLTGNSANNSLNGGTGADTMAGGAGNDSYTVDNVGDVITELTGEGTDSVSSSVTYTLSANVENLTLTGTTAINGTGNASDNVLTGNSANNTLTGGAGNDTLDGGAGNDTMVGGAGNDTYVVNVATDVVTELASEGTDTVQSSVTLTLASNVENLTLTGTTAINGTGNTLDNLLTGNSANNTLTGAAGNDTLDGGAGNDTMVGGAGNDVYYANVSTDVITENAAEGTDTVNAAVTWTLGSNLENLTLTGTTAINGTGNTLDNWLTGNSAANTLTGAAGNDTLDGAGGNDTLVGGAGADSYRFGRGWGLDTVQENDATAGVKDLVLLQGTVTQADVTFSQAGNNLEMLIGATGDKLVFTNWYLGSTYHAEEFRFTDGSVLTDSQAQGLVGAMAAFGGSSASSSTSASSAQVTIGTVNLAANALV